MSESRYRKNRQQRFLEEHPHCCFCGGINPAVTIDHVPPRACFPKGYAPQGFEFPACKACNNGTTKQDLIFGFYSMFVDFDESKMLQKEDMKRQMMKLLKGIADNYPDAMPDLARAYPVNRIGSIITPKPVARELPISPTVQNAIQVMGAKLTHALYFHETEKILTSEHELFTAAYQPQREETQNLTSFFTSLLPNLTVGDRTNIKEYGDRFRYIFGYKEREDFFAYAAQFGQGIILWGIVCGPGIEKPLGGPLSSASNWLRGADGAGANTATIIGPV